MYYLLWYSKIRQSYFFLITLYYKNFFNPVQGLFSKIRQKAQKNRNQTWTLFMDIIMASEKGNYDRCYSRCKMFLQKYRLKTKASIQAAIPIVQAYRCHALYERGFYKEAMDEMEAIWKKKPPFCA